MTDVHTLSGAYALDALDPEEASEFRAHLEGCAACRQEVRELRDAAASMGAAAAVLLVGGGAVGVSRVLGDSDEQRPGTPAEQLFQADDARTVDEPTMNGG